MTAALTVAVLLAAFGLGAVLLRRGEAAERARRTAALHEVAALLESPAASVEPSGYPVLRGGYNGRDVALRLVAEQLAFRRLPQLWLVATVRAEVGGDATLDVLRRPTGAEFFSPGQDLAQGFAPPAGWPQDTSVRGAGDAGALLARLSKPLAPLLGEDRLKEITVTPTGVRVVLNLRQGARGSYLLFRENRFPDPRVQPHEAAAALALALFIVREAAQSAEENPDAAVRDALVRAA